MRTAACLALGLLAAGCGKKDTDPGPGGVTVAEARALDQAAEMLEQRRLPPGATETATRAPEASPTAQPSRSPAPAVTS